MMDKMSRLVHHRIASWTPHIVSGNWIAPNFQFDESGQARPEILTQMSRDIYAVTTLYTHIQKLLVVTATYHRLFMKRT